MDIPGYVGKKGRIGASLRGGMTAVYGNRSAAKHQTTEALSRSRTGITVPTREEFFRQQRIVGSSAGRTPDGEYPTSGRI